MINALEKYKSLETLNKRLLRLKKKIFDSYGDYELEDECRRMEYLISLVEKDLSQTGVSN